MAHKRNPEISEHLVTLARLARVQAGVLLEGMVGEHERDGRTWKAEWIALPETCLLTGTALAMARRLLDGLEVGTEPMLANLAHLPGRALDAAAAGTGSAAAIVDAVVRRGRDALAAEPDPWR